MIRFLTLLRLRFARWLLRGAHLEDVHFGRNSLVLSPVASGDLLRWSSSQVPAALGDMGMDVTTGRPQYHDGSAALPVGTDRTLIPHVNGGLYSTNQTGYIIPGLFTVVENRAQTPVPAGRLVGLAVNITDNGANNACTFTARKNGVDTAITISVAGATNGVFRSSGFVAFAANDLLSLLVSIPAGGPSIGIRSGLLEFAS